MAVTTNLRGRLRNTPLPKNRALVPLFEAVVNSLHSIEDATGSPNEGFVKVRVIRSDQTVLELSERSKPGPDPNAEITGFEILDNGIGFTDDNFESFKTLDSGYKSQRGCRGIGRLFWLIAFQGVTVTSNYEAHSGNLMCRRFDFTPDDGVVREAISTVPDNVPRTTTVLLHGFRSPYRETAPKKLQSIARELLEHCLWYFIREGGTPQITLCDDDEQICLDDIYESYMAAEAKTEAIEVKGTPFELIHVRLSTSVSRHHSITYCAANRPVKEDNLAGKITGLSGQLQVNDTPFRYSCFVTSTFLDDHVRPERADFSILDEGSGLFQESEISFSDLRTAILARIEVFLADQLEHNRKRAQQRVEDFAANVNPRYRPILKHIPTPGLDVDPDISDRDLDLALHKVLYDAERHLLDLGHSLMVPRDDEGPDVYKARLQNYLSALEDVKKSDLASYVSHRKVVIDLLEVAIRRNREHKYEREDVVHDLIMPMRKDSNEVPPDRLNLWLIDERLAFHNYLASDVSISSMPISDCDDRKRPDVCALRVWDQPVLLSESAEMPMASITVVEIKRPMRNDAGPGEDDDPIEQALGYLKRIRDGGVTTADGRPIPRSQNIPGFCYVVCDITSTVRGRCELHDATATADGMGYFFFHKTYNSYVEVFSFERLIRGAKERNRAFFATLGLPTK